MQTVSRPPTKLQMSLKFDPITLVFKDLRYSVPMPAAAKPKDKSKGKKGPSEKADKGKKGPSGQTLHIQSSSVALNAADHASGNTAEARLELLKVWIHAGILAS